MNLVLNARDAMPQGGILTIEARNVQLDRETAAEHPEVAPGRYVMMSVRDTGTGMDRDTQQRLFEPFFTTKERGKGTGLGLPMVYGIVKQHGGTVAVQSQLGVGSTFAIYLPLADSARVEGKSRPRSAVVANHGGETILVVDDNDIVRSTVCELLRSLGYRPLAADSLEGARIVADGHDGPIALLLTDVILSKSNGKEVFRSLSAQRKELKVLYMSGYTGNVIVQHGVLDEDTGLFVQKPLSLDTLSAKIREVLDGP
jgi:CheY-like chemotaxis protein